jgi:outer membrane receptor protein involved in Fe transport
MASQRIGFFVLPVLLCAAAAYATIFGNVRGIVHDPDHRPIQGAQVTIRSASSAWLQTAQTDSDGQFEFSAVPVGEYRVTVVSEGLNPMEQRVVVASGSAPVLHFQLKLAVAHESVEVSENADAVNPESSTTATLVERAQIERTPGADRTNSLAIITDYVPGAYVTHDQLHIRGGHQVTWSVDGVPVPNTNIASNVGPQFDPKDVDVFEIQRGGYSAEYGDRTYGVFNVIPRTGFERNREGELVSSYGSFRQTNDQLSLGSHTERFAYYASVNGNRSDFGLETPTPAVIHDLVSGFGGFGTLVFNANQANQLRLVASLRRDHYQIPNDPGQQARGIRDVERESDAFVNFSWVHTAGPGVLLTVSPFYHFNRAHYIGGSSDTPLSPEDNRGSTYAGAQITLSAVTGKHNARAGIYGFGQRDNTLFGITANDGSDLSLRQKETIAGNLEALFLEDQYKILPWLTLNGGVRLTHFSGAISENAASPRAGAAIRIPRLNWVLRGFYGRYYQAPPLSTVSGPLLAFALDQGFGFLPLHGERDEQHEFGLTIPLRGWTFDVDNFHTRARNFFDHNVLGNSNIFFPVTIDGARIRGWEVTVRSPKLFHRGQAHLAYSNQHAEGFGAVSGGLTDFSPPEEGFFLLDHDQRHTLSTGFAVSLPRHAWAAGNFSYASGFADNGGPAHLPGHTTADLSLGKSMGESWSVSVNALNVANRRFLLDNSLTFGGMHFADPRQIFVQLRYRFHY